MGEGAGPAQKAAGQDVSEVAGWSDQYHGRLLRYLRRSLKLECDAQDVSQEVFLRLLRVPEDRVIEHPGAYLFRVAANVVNDWRTGQKMLETASPEDLDRDPAPDDNDEDYDNVKRQQQVRDALRALPAHYRAALLLKAQHGMTYREIASRLDVSERMVKRYIVKAYARLREDLAVLGPGDQ